MERKFKLYFSTTSIDTKSTYTLIRETKTLLFFKRDDAVNKEWIYRVNKRSNKIKIINSNWNQSYVKLNGFIELINN